MSVKRRISITFVCAFLRGSSAKQRLRFTKTGDPKLEEAYSRHFVWPPFYPPASKRPHTRCDEAVHAVETNQTLAAETSQTKERGT